MCPLDFLKIKCKFWRKKNVMKSWCAGPQEKSCRWFKAIWDGIFRSLMRKDEYRRNKLFSRLPVNGQILSIICWTNAGVLILFWLGGGGGGQLFFVWLFSFLCYYFYIYIRTQSFYRESFIAKSCTVHSVHLYMNRWYVCWLDIREYHQNDLLHGSLPRGSLSKDDIYTCRTFNTFGEAMRVPV